MKLLERIGFGRLTGAFWLNNESILMATTAGLFSYDLKTEEKQEYLCRLVNSSFHSIEHELLACIVEYPREILVISTKDGKQVQRLKGHDKGLIKCIAISPDGKLVASGGSDRMLRIREISSGKEVLTIEHPGGFSSMDGNPDKAVWSSDGEFIATADKDGNVYLWQSDGKPVHKWKAGRWVHSLLFTPDNKHIITASNPPSAVVSAKDRHFHVWQLDGTNVNSLHLPNSEEYVEEQRSLAFSPNGSLVASGGRDGALHIIDTVTWERKSFIPKQKIDPDEAEWQKLKLGILILEFSPDGKSLLVGTTPWANLGMGQDIISLSTFRTDEWTRTWCLRDFASQVNDISLSNEGNLAMAIDHGTHISDGAEGFKKIDGLNANRLDWSPDGAKICIGANTFQGQAVIVDVESRKVEQELAVLKNKIDDIDFSPDGKHIATAVDDVRIWKLGRKSAVKKLKTAKAKGLAFSSDGALLAVASWQEAVKLWTVPKGKLQLELKPTKMGRFTATAFSAGDKLVAGVGYEGKNYVWQVSDGKLVAALGSAEDTAALWSVAFSPDGKFLVDGSWEGGKIRLWSTDDWTLVKAWRAHGQLINKLVFTDDSKKLYSAAGDGSVCLWEIA